MASQTGSRREWLRATAFSVAGFFVGLVGGYYLGKPEEKQGREVPDTSDNLKLCICPDCLTFKGSPLTGGLYCGTGKAKEPIRTLGCICGKCPLTSKYGLKTGYFCFKGRSRDVLQ